ncbi:MAG: hypothetical protein II517_00220 [Ruminococcus sp.]|nr:hypothetical protein [Ruminococcus sp.]
MAKTKLNPRRRPATQADVERAREQAVKEAVKCSMAIFFTVLLDKEGADAEILKRVWREVNDLSESVKEGYVSLNDLKTTLKEEYDVELD